MSVKLCCKTLDALPPNVSKPNYTKESLSAGIVHIGVGNFHRAHQAVYLDRLFNLGLDHDWGIVGAGIKHFDAAMRDKLQAQDWLTTVVELDANGLTAKVTGAMIDFVDIDADALISALVDPQIRIVSLTITEGGYFIDAKTGGLQLDHPDIKNDIEHPDAPHSVFGILIKGLVKRRDAGIAPFTIMSCDNVPHNGKIAQQTLLSLARRSSPEEASWIAENVAFPNSMVDCITPATSDREKNKLLELFDIDDSAPVFCEPFRQWVLEDNFPQGRPALEKVGVEFVEDVAPHELMKLRILNGGHMALAFAAALMGCEFVHDAMDNPQIGAYLRKLAKQDIIPSLPAVPGVNFSDYFSLIEQRFSNPEIADTIARLCCDSSNRLPKFILPTIRANIEDGRSIKGLSLVIAAWCRFCAATTEPDTNLTLQDEQAEELTKQALLARSQPGAFLQMENIFGDLADSEQFVKAFSSALNSLWQQGVQNTLQDYISS
jgi:mannitol 2-dehydrogenase